MRCSTLLVLSVFICAPKMLFAAGDVSRRLVRGLIVDRKRHVKREMPLPPLGKRVKDPAFGTTLIRITDVSEDGDFMKPAYSPQPAWNADESLLLLWKRKAVNGCNHFLFDGVTYKQLRGIKLHPADLEQVFWHPTDPDKLFYPSRTNKIYLYRPSTNETILYAEFPQYRKIRFSSHMYAFSNDGKYTAFIAQTEKGQWRIVVYDMDKKSIVAVRSPEAKYKGKVAISPSGKYVVKRQAVYDARTLRHLRDLPFTSNEHMDLGFLDGEDYYVRVNYDDKPEGITAYRLSDGSARALIPDYYPPSGTHVSCKSLANPGWVYISSIRKFAGREPFNQEIYMARLDGSVVARICHHRTLGKEISYFAEPHPVPSPSGTRVVFGSTWGAHKKGNAYVCELPAYALSGKPGKK